MTAQPEPGHRGGRDDASFADFVAARLGHLLKLGRALAGDERESLDRDVDPDARRMVDDVRRGARRRRNRRRAVVAGAAAAVLIVGSFGASRLLTDDGPAPADESGATSPTHVRAIAPADSGLLAASYEPDCECTVVWRHQHDWERVRVLHGRLGQLAMTSDGVHGLLSSDGPRVDVTHDGGETWSTLRIEDRDQLFEKPSREEWVWAGHERLWIMEAASEPWRVTRMWQGPADGNTVTPVAQPDFEVDASGTTTPPITDFDGILVTIRPVGPEVTAPYLSEDGGATWQRQQWPCQTDREPRYLHIEGDVSVQCDGGHKVAYRTSDLRDWQPLQLQDEVFYGLWTLGGGSYLALTTDGAVLATTDGATEVDPPFDPDSIDDATEVRGTHYVAAAGAIYESTDAGRTWQELED